LIGPAHLHPLPLSQGERRQSTQGFTRFRSYAARRRPNILWSHPIRTPSNCVIFRL